VLDWEGKEAGGGLERAATSTFPRRELRLHRSLQRGGEKGSALAPGSEVWRRGEWCEGLRASGVGLNSCGGAQASGVGGGRGQSTSKG
jgi:hypothetical protein